MPGDSPKKLGKEMDQHVDRMLGRVEQDARILDSAVAMIELISKKPEQHLAAISDQEGAPDTWVRLLSMVDLVASHLRGMSSETAAALLARVEAANARLTEMAPPKR